MVFLESLVNDVELNGVKYDLKFRIFQCGDGTSAVLDNIVIRDDDENYIYVDKNTEINDDIYQKLQAAFYELALEKALS